MIIEFPLKAYPVRYDRLQNALSASLPGIYTGYECDDAHVRIFLTAPTQDQQNVVYDYWSSLTDVGEATLTQDDIKAKLQARIRKYQDIGRDLVAEFSAENVLLGITIEQVEEVMTTAGKVKLYLEAGSFPTAMSEIDKIPRSSPFFTEERMSAFKQKIADIMAAQ